MIAGRRSELAAIAAALDAARRGTGTALWFEGGAGIGKSALLDAAVEAAPDFLVVRTVGTAGDFALGHAGLTDVVRRLQPFLDAVPEPQRRALDEALGRTGTTGAGRPYLVAAGTLSLLAAAAAERPVLLVVDDLDRVDPESVTALVFAVRRLGHDAVAAVLAGRRPPDGEALTGLAVHRLTGLDGTAVRELLRHAGAGPVAAPVAARLEAGTGGNPLALTEALRSLTPEQRRGSAALPDVLPVGARLVAAFGRTVTGLPAGTRRALVLAAAGDGDAGPVADALRTEGVDLADVLPAAERADVLVLRDGRLRFRHPLLRAAVWGSAEPAEQRSAHRSLAGVLPDGSGARVRHLGRATVGHDDEVARRLLDVAARERLRSGFATATALEERAAELTAAPAGAAGCRAAAAEDAFLGGDLDRARRLATAVLDAAGADDAARGRALLVLGTAEQYAGSVPRAHELLDRAASAGSPGVRLRAVAELAMTSYRLGRPDGMATAAQVATDLADPADPEQELLARHTEGAALAFGGRWTEAYAPLARALELLESVPALRDEPRHLATALLTVGWMGEPVRALQFLDRRLDAARATGALGVLPLALSLVAGGAAALDRHELAYAWAGEAVELGTELGYVADVAIATELLAWQLAARGRHSDATAALTEARRLGRVAGVTDAAVQVDLVEAFAALCRGDADRVIAVLEVRLAADGGRLPRGDHPLGVAPDLVEAYLATGRTADATDLARRYADVHRASTDADVRALGARLRAMVAPDLGTAAAAFAEAHRAHAAGSRPFEAARTRLLHGAALRRAGQRVAAREQLAAAAAAFGAMGLDAWMARAEGELAASGRTARRGPRPGDPLTSQETRVVLLVARGLSNREIAAALFVSPKTVEHHVSSALRKRGMRSRTELAVAYS
jgi:DNA-binding CsgD family transcriptional regulator/tetratricopeptide (TPR) repeat protein